MAASLPRPHSSRNALGIATVGGKHACSSKRDPPHASNIKRSQIEGLRAMRLICAMSGSAWMFWAATFAPTARKVWLALITVMTVLIGGRAVMQVQAARR